MHDYVDFMLHADEVCKIRGIVIEDFGNYELIPPNPKIRDAERRGQQVILKFVARESAELNFLRLLDSVELRRHPENRTIKLLDRFAVDEEFDCLVLPKVSTFDNRPAIARLAPTNLLAMAQQMREYVTFLAAEGLVHRDLKLENVGFRAVGPGAELVVLDLGRMERRNTSDLVHEYFVPHEYSPPEFDSRKGCSPFEMDAFAAGVVAEKLEAMANVT
ncbi:hypothetical protein HK405_008526, partial [Cladochytrium tenue]